MAKKKSEYHYVRKHFRFDGVQYEVVGATEEEAIRKKLEKLQALEAGRVTSSTTVKQWAKVWMETYVKPRKITEKTRSGYQGYLDRVIVPQIGSMKLSRVTQVRLQALLNSRTDNSTSDVTKLRLVLRGMFRKAYESRLIAFDPSAGLELPRSSAGKHRSLTASEREALIHVAGLPTFDGKKNRSGCWLMLMLRCGLRPGETAALKKSSVDLPVRILTVTEAKEAGSSRIKDPKTASGIRSVPIPEDLVPWLERQLTDSLTDYLFTQKDRRTPLSETSMRRRWETVKRHMDLYLGAKTERVKLPGARRHSLIITESVLADDLDLYDLRHTYCTDLEKAGVPLNIAKVLMGHKDISTTANIYTHADAETVETARTLINARRQQQPMVEKPVEKANSYSSNISFIPGKLSF